MAASKTIYLTVRVDIFNPNVEEITDDEAQDVVTSSERPSASKILAD